MLIRLVLRNTCAAASPIVGLGIALSSISGGGPGPAIIMALLLTVTLRFGILRAPSVY